MNNQPKTFDNFDFNRVRLRETKVDWNDFVEEARNERELFLKKVEIKKEIITEFVSSRNERLILWGFEGRGKSHLAKAILNQHKKRRLTYPAIREMFSGTRYDYISTITKNIKAYDLYDIFFNIQPHLDCDTVQDACHDYRHLIETEILIVDDLCSEKETEKEIFPQGFLKLLDNYSGKLIITTNRAPISLFNRYKAKIFSRMFGDAMVVCIEGPDSRFLKESKGVEND